MNPVEVNQIAWLRERGQATGRIIEEPYATWTIAERRGGMIDVAGCFFDPSCYVEQVDHILRTYQEAGMPANICYGPSATPEGLSKHLRSVRRCMGPVYLPGMELDLTKWITPEVSAKAELIRWDSGKSLGYPILDWYPRKERAVRADIQSEVEAYGNSFTFAVREGDEFLSQALVFLHEGVAGIYDVYTKAEARGQGLAKVCVVAALQFALERGCRHSILISHKKAVHVYQKLGYVETGLFRSFYYSRPRMTADAMANGTQDSNQQSA